MAKVTPPKKTTDKYPEVKDIKQDIESLKGNTVDLAQHVKSDGVEKVKEGLERVEASADVLKDIGRNEVERAEKHIKKNPMQSVAIAFAGGLALSLLLRGRR